MSSSKLTPAKAAELFKASVEEAIRTCTWPSAISYQTPLPGGNLTVHQVFEIVTGVAGIISISIALYLMVGHLLHWTQPLKQKQQVRIIAFLIVYSVVNFLCVWFYNNSPFIDPVGEFYEGVAIVSVFLFYMQVIASNAPSLYAFCEEFRSKNDGGMARFRRVWIFVFQIIILRVCTLIAFEILAGVTCPISWNRIHGHMGITAVQGVSTGIAVLQTIRFERWMKEHLHPEKPILKLFAFKVVIVLKVLQNFIFDGLLQQQLWIPSPPYYMSYNDFLRGLPPMILNLEIMFASIVFLWAYSFAKHRAESQQAGCVAAGPVAALASSINPLDILYGILYAVTGSEKALTKALGGFPKPLVAEENDLKAVKSEGSDDVSRQYEEARHI